MFLKKLNLLMLGSALAICPNVVEAADLAPTIGSFNSSGTPTQYVVEDGKTVKTTTGATLEVGPDIRNTSGEFTIKGGTNKTGVLEGHVSVTGTNAATRADLTVENLGNYSISNTESASNYYGKITDTNVTSGWRKLINTSDSIDDDPWAAIAVENGDLTITNSVFMKNQNNQTVSIQTKPEDETELKGTASKVDAEGTNGGAISLQKNSNLIIENSLFYKNITSSFGGAIDADDATSNIELIKGSYFITNTANIHGGALDIHNTAKSIRDTVFYDNLSYGLGGAVYIHEGASVANANAAKSEDNGFYKVTFDKNQAGRGGAIYQMTGGTGNRPTVVQDSIFKNNVAAAIRMTDEERARLGYDGAGSAIRIGGQLNTTGSTFQNNEVVNADRGTAGGTHAALGGTVYVSENGEYASTNDTFTSNTSVANAGAIYNAGTTTVEGTTFDGNEASGDGGAIYNKGVLTLNGADITFKNNKADGLGNDIYNAIHGVVNIENAKDDIDLDYSQKGLFNPSDVPDGRHTMFTDSGDIVNLGTMNIKNSALQLHNGINTNANLTTLAQKRSGTVNIEKSRIDIGGAGVNDDDTTGVIYGGTINVKEDSTIQTHVSLGTVDKNGQVKGNETGQLSANNINISDKNTALKMLVKFADAEKWNDDYARLYKVLDSDNIGVLDSVDPDASKEKGFFTDIKNEAFNVEYHSDINMYSICPSGQRYNAGKCECIDPTEININGTCVLKAICDPTTEIYDSSTNKCLCASGYVKDGNQCVPKAICDPTTEIYDSATNKCLCASGYVKDGNQCVPKETCGKNEVYNETTNKCDCKTGYVEVGNQCVLKATCTGDKVYNAATNTCICPSNKPNEYNNQCFAACGENQVFSAGNCVCAPGYEKLSDGTCYKKRTFSCVGLGCDANEEATFDGWINGPSMPEDTEAAEVQEELFETYELGQGKELQAALDGLAPDVSPLVQTHATEITRRLSAIVSDRFYNSMERTGYVHRNKRFYRFPRPESNLWVESMYGKSKYDIRKGWDMDTTGLAIGFDGHVNDAVKLGVSYAYTKADGDSVGRETEIDSHTGMVYGSYNPNRFYTNWLAMYTRSQYDENKRVFNHEVKADYDVDSIAAQIMFGRKMGPIVSEDWATGVIKPEIGARYVYTKQHGYTDSLGQKVGSADGHTLTGILGAQYTIGYTISPTLSWYPELRAALTYDFIEPDTEMRVDLPNHYHYNVKTENMDRLGIEVGARVGLDINRKAEVSLEYEGLFKGDYQNHTGLANLKYKF